MISVNDAFRIIGEVSKQLDVQEVDLKHATGCVLAEDYISTLSFPPFDQSAMDGYAINNSENQFEFNVISELKAGDASGELSLKSGEACRIFTGAMLPRGTTAVVKQEDVLRASNKIVASNSIAKGENVRVCGEQIEKGNVAVKMQAVLNPGAIGFLATLGVKKIKIFRKPKIAIIATGNELADSDSDLMMGKIFESNTSMLLSALSVYGFQASSNVVSDDFELILKEVKQAISENDVVLITGGISVGDYDFVGKVLQQLEVEEKFHKVKQKPGKPLFFGLKNETIVFGLPGNPAAVLTSFYVYVLHALAKMTGRKSGFLTTKQLKLQAGIEKSPNLTFFLKGKIVDDEVTVLPAQSSAMLSSFVVADCIVQFNETQSKWSKGDLVDVFVI